jgi:hypothetical protein
MHLTQCAAKDRGVLGVREDGAPIDQPKAGHNAIARIALRCVDAARRGQHAQFLKSVGIEQPGKTFTRSRFAFRVLTRNAVGAASFDGCCAPSA